ncbi:MAG: surface-adhesin E family protein [Pseudomonadota bacterium]
MERTLLRFYSIGNGLNKITKSEEVDFYLLEDIQKNYLEKFKVISHTEKGRKICEKVQFTLDTEVLREVIDTYNRKLLKVGDFFKDLRRYNDDKKKLCSDGGYYDVEKRLNEYIQEENRTISIGIIVDNKTNNNSKVHNERLGDEIEKNFIWCLDTDYYHQNILRDTVKIIERRYLNKILEEQKLSVSGITDGNTVKVGKVENLDIIFLRMIYDDRTTTKLLNVETGEVLLSKTYETKKEPKKEGWIYYGTTWFGDYYYDNNSITNVSPKITKVWSKTKHSKVSKDDYIQYRKDHLKPTDGYEKFDYEIILYEIDCLNNTSKLMRVVDYNDDGKTLNEYDNPNPEINQVLPGSIIDTLQNKVCNK